VRKAVAIIPARYQSKRFPGKPLALIAGVPLIVRVIQTARKSRHINEVMVITDDERIASVVERYDGQAFLSAKEHATGSDRVAELAEKLDYDYVINLQGDEPSLSPVVIDKVAEALDDPEVIMSSACSPMNDRSEADNPNVVKVVLDDNSDALYFSRSRIPYRRVDNGPAAPIYRHIGIYGFKRDFLLKFAAYERTPLEISESLEQLRALEHGHKIRVLIVESEFSGIDSPEDLVRVEEIFSKQGIRDGGKQQ
jgi:3-deoxy-manno-octulosonate cytidylyltransferase (CMP-KDO synthetase)